MLGYLQLGVPDVGPGLLDLQRVIALCLFIGTLSLVKSYPRLPDCGGRFILRLLQGNLCLLHVELQIEQIIPQVAQRYRCVKLFLQQIGLI